jgi:hypothetical protein
MVLEERNGASVGGYFDVAAVGGGIYPNRRNLAEAVIQPAKGADDGTCGVPTQV